MMRHLAAPFLVLGDGRGTLSVATTDDVLRMHELASQSAACDATLSSRRVER